ncbi:MAG: helix-turn-helix domain-containing protein [Thermomicrobia bacterium]|nr:helix-turn-helix domain-containing protein [Thermomicrobia bacterium]MCA1723287.1 helix-turn-helix domain-containing protein [Thermomicrobia bacterium]
MNRQEQQRGLVIGEVDRGTLSVGEGAVLLGLSVRHVRRLLAAYRQRGITALARGNRGRALLNAVNEQVSA